MKNNVLEGASRKTITQICSFAFSRYGNGVEGDEWAKRMYDLSPLGIARLYFQEWVNWEDVRRKEDANNGDSGGRYRFE